MMNFLTELSECNDYSDKYKLLQQELISILDSECNEVVIREKFNKAFSAVRSTCKKPRIQKVSDYIYLTINLRPDHGLEPSEFVGKLLRLCEQAKIKEYMFCIEQRSDEVFDVNSLHAHILMKRSATAMPSHIKQSAKIIFNDYCDTKNTSIFNFHICPVEFVEDKRNYIEGNKNSDSEKMNRISTDDVMRKYYGLQKVYKSSDKNI